MTRYQLLKLRKGYSTKAERQFAELLKELHIPFRTKVKVQGYEVDFLIDNFAIEIAGHRQNSQKNIALLKAGLTPIFIYNYDVGVELKEWLKKLKSYGR